MFNDWLTFFTFFTDSWLIQGVIVNFTCSILFYPFIKFHITNFFKNSKRERIKKAQNHLNMEIIKRLYDKENIEKADFYNLVYIISNKYNLNIKDIFDEETFIKNITQKIVALEYLSDETKEKFIYKMRTNETFNICPILDNIYTQKDEEKNYDYHDYDKNHIASSDIELDSNEKRNTTKYTHIIAFLVFIFLFLITSIAHVLYNAYGLNSIIFINTVIIVVSISPILINGFVYLDTFNIQNKKFFYLLIIVLLLNIINFICMVNFLLR